MQIVSNERALEMAKEILIAKIQVSNSSSASIENIKSSLKELYDFIKTLD